MGSIKKSVGRLGLGLSLLALALLGCATASAETLVAGPVGAPMSLSEAVVQARDGDVIELLPGEYAGQPVLLAQRQLTVRAAAPGVLVRGDGKPGAARAMWTVRGGEVTLEGITFRGARSMEGEGAAVRHEGGRLHVRRCEFFDNETGLISANDEAAELHIEDSVFGMAPRVVGGLHHLLNVGRIGKFSVQGSRFQQGFEGHLIKTRARESSVRYNFIHDGVRGGASYEIEFAAGGVATVVGNVIAQGAETRNPVLVAYATESHGWPKNALLLAHNTLINYGWTPAWFLRVIGDSLPADTDIVAINNLVVGGGIFRLGARGRFEGNRPATLGMLSDASTYGFELPPGALWRGSGVDPRKVAGHDLSPQAEYEWPLGVRKLPQGRTQWTPGAYQR